MPYACMRNCTNNDQLRIFQAPLFVPHTAVSPKTEAYIKIGYSLPLKMIYVPYSENPLGMPTAGLSPGFADQKEIPSFALSIIFVSPFLSHHLLYAIFMFC